MGYVGAAHSLTEGSNGLRPPGEYKTGGVVAVDPSTNLVRWKKLMPYSLAHGNGILTTASDLLFIGQPDGNLLALDATSGRELWRFQTGAAISASPITYEIDGEQYVAILRGRHRHPVRHQRRDRRAAGRHPDGVQARRDARFRSSRRRRRRRRGGRSPAIPVDGASVNNTVLARQVFGATAAEQSINSGSTQRRVPDPPAGPGRHHGDVRQSRQQRQRPLRDPVLRGAVQRLACTRVSRRRYTFTQAGEYFFNDCYNPRSTAKIEVQ